MAFLIFIVIFIDVLLLNHAKCKATSCGVSSITSNLRVVGGEEAKPHQYPWIVYLEMQYTPIAEGLEELYANCDGTLLDSKWIVTAAHCFDLEVGYKLTRVAVVLGAHNLANQSESRTIIYAKKLYRHSLYVKGLAPKYDIAMVQLSRTLDFAMQSHLAPICLPSTGEQISSTQCQVLGWGWTSNVDERVTVLRTVSLSKINALECAKYQRSEVSELQICAGYAKHGPCNGDAGGPLQCKNADGNWVLEGIVSYGDKICGGDRPSVFTNVEKFVDWITQIKVLI